MRYLWLDVNSSYSHSSLALPALTAQLTEKQLNKDWKVVSGTLKTNPLSLIQEITQYHPDVIFSTCWLFNREFVLTILSKVNALNPDIKIYLGGPEFLGDNNSFLKQYKYVTGVFRGEAEEVFPDFTDNLERQNYCPEIEGFCYLQHGENRINTTVPKRAVCVKDFEQLNAPEISPFFRWDKPFVQLETSRGCFNSCAFCVSGDLNNKTQNVSIEVLRDRINNIREHKIKEIRILDRTFNANPKRAIELLNLFEEFKGDIRFHVEIHPAFLTEEVRRKLLTIDKDLLHIEAGVQSLQQEVLDCSRRKGDVEKTLDGIKFIKENNIGELHLDLIAGLPKYTFGNLLSDLDKLIDIEPEEIQLELLKLLPGTELRENASTYNIVYSPIPPYEVLQTNEISYIELINISIISKIIDYWYNNPVWRSGFINVYRSFKESLWEKIIEYLGDMDLLTSSHSQESKGSILYDFTDKYKPDLRNEVSLCWIKNGFSLKKRPAQDLRLWDGNESNPLFDKENFRERYYYLKVNNIIHWFVFEKDKNRNKPVRQAMID